MTNAFGMGTMGMRIKANIVKIGRSPFCDLPNKFPFGMGFNFWWVHIPCIYIGTLSGYRYGNIQGLG